MVTVADPHRPGAEVSYYPGEVNIRIADVVVLNKIDSAYPEHIKTVRDNIQKINPKAIVVDGASPIRVDDESVIRGKNVLVIEDGPTLTHGEMKIGAGVVAAQKYGAAEMVDPRPYVVGKLAETFRIYPNIGQILPAMGYGDQQIKDLEATINKVKCDSVVIATPIDLNRIVKIKKPNTRVYYDLQEIGKPDLDEILAAFLKKFKINRKK
jgi:predicted GTPase